MTKEELEKIELPEIELLSHKHKLRRFLMSRYSIEQKRGEVFAFLRPVLVGGFAFAVLLGVVLNISFFTQPSLALAKEIALRDSRIRSLIDQGAIMKETEFLGNKGFILVQLMEKPKEKRLAGKAEDFFMELEPPKTSSIFLVEVDFKGKKVSEIKEVSNSLSPFSQEEEQKIREISRESEMVKKEIPFEAEIKKIQPVLPQLKLIKKGNRVEMTSEKGAVIIYKQNNKEWKGEVNLGADRVERIEFLGEGDQ